MLLQGEDQFRVTTDDQTIVSDGTTLWTYSKPSNRVLIDRLEKTDQAVLPRQLFFEYKKDYQVRLGKEETLNESPCYVLIFSAEKRDVYIVQIRVWVDKDKWIPRKIEQTDLSKNKTTFILSSIETRVATDAGMFQFVVPEGAEVIKL
jgi:outer membrane lipoprotein-sorting protein